MGRSVGSDTKMQARLAGSPRTGSHQTSKERVTQKRQPATNPAEVHPGEHHTTLHPGFCFCCRSSSGLAVHWSSSNSGLVLPWRPGVGLLDRGLPICHGFWAANQ